MDIAVAVSASVLRVLARIVLSMVFYRFWYPKLLPRTAFDNGFAYIVDPPTRLRRLAYRLARRSMPAELPQKIFFAGGAIRFYLTDAWLLGRSKPAEEGHRDFAVYSKINSVAELRIELVIFGLPEGGEAERTRLAYRSRSAYERQIDQRRSQHGFYVDVYEVNAWDKPIYDRSRVWVVTKFNDYRQETWVVIFEFAYASATTWRLSKDFELLDKEIDAVRIDA
jgi:hypothetical protein